MTNGSGRLQAFQATIPLLYCVTVGVFAGDVEIKSTVPGIWEKIKKFVYRRKTGFYISLSSDENDFNEKTRTIYSNKSGTLIWKETFTFHIDAHNPNFLKIALIEEGDEYKFGTRCFDLNSIPEDNSITEMFNFETSKVKVQFSLKADEPHLRLSADISDEEKKFVSRRKKLVHSALQKLFGQQKHLEMKEVPVIAIVSSGGGFRATISQCGVYKALQDTGILDCVMYAGATSGSAWFLSTFMSHPKFPNLAAVTNELRIILKNNGMVPPRTETLEMVYKLIEEKKEQKLTLSDIFSLLLRHSLLKNNKDATLSQQRQNLTTGNSPMPIYSALHVKKSVKAVVFNEEIEFNPFEIGFPKYGVYMKTEHFGSQFYFARMRKNLPEWPLFRLQGIWGSAWSVLPCFFWKWFWPEESNVEPTEPEESYRKERDEFRMEDAPKEQFPRFEILSTITQRILGMKWKAIRIFRNMLEIIFCCGKIQTIQGRATEILNPLRGLKLMPLFENAVVNTSPDDVEPFKGEKEPLNTDDPYLYIVDGGLINNLPFPLLLRPERGVQLFLAFDYSTRKDDDSNPFEDILRAEDWAKRHQVPFPPIKELVSKYYAGKPNEEYYIFRDKDERVPTVILFIIVNDKFRKCKAPGVARDDAEKNFADFKIFDAENTFGTLKMKYSYKKFCQLSKLMNFNVLLGSEVIKTVIEDIVFKGSH